MNVLFISYDLTGITLASKLIEEGNRVKIFERVDGWKDKIYRPGIQFINDWKKELHWVGKDGLIIFDYSGMADVQEKLRKEGYSVFGGGKLGEMLENNRQYGQKIFSAAGINIKNSKDFYNIEEMVRFVQKHRGKWVVKQNGNSDKGLNYVGSLESGEDVISILKSYKKILKTKHFHFDLQEKIEGIEIAVGRYFNGNNWIGPICINVEHKGLFNGNLGPKGEEMGSLVWYEISENKLFKAVLDKMKEYLARVGYRGYFDINCIVDENNAYPLEATARLAYPTTQAQMSLLQSPWGKFLKSIADSKNYNPNYKKEYCVLVFIGTPPYPYRNNLNYHSPKGLSVIFKEKLNKKESGNIYFEEVSFADGRSAEEYSVCGKSGYIAHVAGTGKTISKARKNAYQLVEKIIIPKMFYRTDIGAKMEDMEFRKLKKWGWL